MPEYIYQLIWFFLVGILITGYAILDGFDLGVGALHLFVKKDLHRRLLLNSIGPVWDGNEVWLVVGGGALFAAFPNVYATVFSGFYEAFMLLLVMLIFRAVAIEFRSKKESPIWRKTWDVLFSVGSIGATVLIGVAMGNIVQGIPLDERGNYMGTFWDLLTPYPILMGVTVFALFSMHGVIYLLLKTEGELHEIIRNWIRPTMILFILCYLMLSMATLLYLPHMTTVFRSNPGFFILVVATVLVLANIPREIMAGRDGRAFLSSSLLIMLMMGLFALGYFPNMVLDPTSPENSLTIWKDSSSLETLKVMTIIAGIGVPVVLAYSAGIYWVFRGKVSLDKHSY